MKLNPMTNHMTYENLLDTVDSFEAYLNEIKRLQEEKAAQEKQEAQRQRELAEQRKKERAIADDKAAYESAKCTNTKAAYEKYLKNFANAVYRTEAKAKVDHFLKIEQEEQARIQQQKETEAQRQRYLEEQRKKEQAGQQKQEAQRQREQAIANTHQAFKAAKRTDTISAYETYLKNHPDGSTRDKYDAIYRINYFTKIEADRKAAREEERQFTQKARWSKFWAMASGISMSALLISDRYDNNLLIALIFMPLFSVLLGGIFGIAIRIVLNKKEFIKDSETRLVFLVPLIFSSYLAYNAFSEGGWKLSIIIFIIFVIITYFISLTMASIFFGLFSEIKNIYASIVSPIRFIAIWAISWSIIGWIITNTLIPNFYVLFEIYRFTWTITGFGLGLLIMNKFTRQL